VRRHLFLLAGRRPATLPTVAWLRFILACLVLLPNLDRAWAIAVLPPEPAQIANPSTRDLAAAPSDQRWYNPDLQRWTARDGGDGELEMGCAEIADGYLDACDQPALSFAALSNRACVIIKD